jgi:PadR family transcriptional regulator PadR
MAAQPILSNFELMVMLAIIRIGDDAYGVSISNEIEETTGNEVLLGSVYDALTRLQEKGLITSSLGEATAARRPEVSGSCGTPSSPSSNSGRDFPS